MKKSNSHQKQLHNKNYNSGANDSRNKLHTKNKTISTIVHT
jgi:hypothetical protein